MHLINASVPTGSPCTGTASTCPTRWTASPGSPRTPSRSAATSPTASWPSRPGPTGTTRTRSRTPRSSADCSARSSSAPQARLARAGRVLATAHTYGGRKTLNGQPGDLRVAGQPGSAGPGPGDQHRQRPDPDLGRRPYRVLAVDGHEINEPDRRSTDRAVTVTGGRRVDLGVTCRPTVSRSGSRCRRRTAVILGPGDPAAPPQPAETGSAELRNADAAAVRPGNGRPAVRVLHRPAAGIRQGPARAVVVDQRAALSRTSRCTWCARATSSPCTSTTTAARSTRCTCTATTRWCCPATGWPATGSPWWVDTLNVADRRDLRHRLRGRQPRHLDGPLPQPQARRGRHGRAPDVRRGRHPVRRSAGRPATSRSSAGSARSLGDPVRIVGGETGDAEVAAETRCRPGSLTVQAWTSLPAPAGPGDEVGVGLIRSRSGPTILTPSGSRPVCHRPRSVLDQQDPREGGQQGAELRDGAEREQITVTGEPGRSQPKSVSMAATRRSTSRPRRLGCLVSMTRRTGTPRGPGLAHHGHQLAQRHQLALLGRRTRQPPGSEVEPLQLGHREPEGPTRSWWRCGRRSGRAGRPARRRR